ncbi:hypothetical protein G9A89_022478 [Geosiphon pyriformis]|nr:hypothetical protein G9A89_022478 [Geosiphon pyriformis]
MFLQAAKASGFNASFKSVLPKKKRRGGALEEDSNSSIVSPKVQVGHSWGSEAGDTTKSNSIDIEEECLVEETSFDFGDGGALAGRDPNQTPTDSKVKTKKALGKPFGKINFSVGSNDNSVLLDAPLNLSPSLKNMVNISVHKSFVLDIGLNKISGKSSQKKLMMVKKLFSKVNAMFTSESSLMKATKLATDTKILVNTNLKKSTGHSDWAVVLKEILVGTSAKAVCAALSEFGTIKSIKMQLVGLWQKTIIEFEEKNQADLLAARWSILIRKDAVRVAKSDLNKLTWDMRDHYRVLLYTLSTKCAVVCFESAESLDAIMGTTSCGKLGHTSLGCVSGGKSFSGGLPHHVLLDADKSRLAAIYAKHLALVACPVSFGGVSWTKIVGGSLFSPLPVRNVSLNNGFSLEMKPTPQVSLVLNDRFATLEHSLVSLAKCMDKLAKRLDALGLMVSQLSSGHQLLADIVMSKGLDVDTGGGTVAEMAVFDSSIISKMEETLRNLSIMVMSLSAKIDNANSVPAPYLF